MSTERRMRELLATLAPESLDIADESAAHAGHEGARGGGGHFAITIVSPRFKGKNPVARHRLVYDALAGLMRKEIHALSIRAFTPDEI